MDLNDLWQAHKRFILGVGGGLLVLLIAHSIITSTWPVRIASGRAASANNKIGRQKVPSRGEVSELEDTTRGYEERLEGLYERLGYQVSDRYRLPDGGAASPDLLFNDIRARASEELVDAARRYNIYVDPSLGLPEFTPPGREAIERTLRALNIVEQVVVAAIGSEVDAVDKIEILKPRITRKKEAAFIDALQVRFEVSGPTGALADLVDRITRDSDPYLSVEEFELERNDARSFGLTRMKLVVAGLAIEPEATVTGGRS